MTRILNREFDLEAARRLHEAVSYTHLTLPTIA